MSGDILGFIRIVCIVNASKLVSFGRLLGFSHVGLCTIFHPTRVYFPMDSFVSYS
ncbi:uncharacterized protein LOC112082881 [Eutrema salsugineum]|uniref:uncharacterized protein LOC112082881 n=1 Tax=Eutrema salsugineum TaxID=72664 RepID=UPI000CED22F0|nr:uncharacterized protein LOC112082881 [Eutrema salsugineum]